MCSIWEGEAIEFPALNVEEGAEGGSAGAELFAEGDAIAEVVADDGHGEGVEGGGDELARLHGLNGLAIQEDLGEDGGFHEVEATGGGALGGDEVEFIGAVVVEDGGLEALLDVAAEGRGEGFGSGDDEAGADEAAIFISEEDGGAGEAAGVAFDDIGIEGAELGDDGFGGIEAADFTADEEADAAAEGIVPAKVGDGRIGEGYGGAAVCEAEAEGEELAEADGHEELIFGASAEDEEGAAGGAAGGPGDEAGLGDAAGDAIGYGGFLEEGAGDDGDAMEVLDALDMAGVEAGGIEEAAIEGDVFVGVADEAAELRVLETQDGGAGEGREGAEGLEGGGQEVEWHGPGWGGDAPAVPG